MIRDPVYREAVKHRQAAVEDSRLIRHAVLPVGKTFGEQIGGHEGPPIVCTSEYSPRTFSTSLAPSFETPARAGSSG
jgi:hypothetical protein